MINSSISSAHFFYLVFIKSEKIDSIKSLISGFKEKKQYKKILLGNVKDDSYTHLQIQIAKAYGSPLVLTANKAGIIEERQAYWYDFYIGEFQNETESLFYLMYPYSKMSKYIEKAISEVDRQATYIKPKLSSIIPYLKTFKNSNKLIYSVDIVKYSAEVKEDTNKISIVGSNPLNSNVLKALEANNINFEATAVKLRYAIDPKNIELAFDRLGNYRFWLKTEGQQAVFPIIPNAYDFFKKSKTLEDSFFISTYTLLEENEQQ